VVDDAVRSLVVAATPAEYLATARERAARARRERLRAIDTALAARGVRATLDGGPVEHDGGWYELYTDAHRGVLFAELHPLGALPRAARFEHRRPATPRGIGNWPDVVWLAHDGTRMVRRDFDGDLLLSAALDARLASRHAGDPGRAHFYAARVSLLGGGRTGDDPTSVDLDWMADASRRLRALFAAGAVVRVSPDGERPTRG
jgi:hypothetical protein